MSNGFPAAYLEELDMIPPSLSGRFPGEHPETKPKDDSCLIHWNMWRPSSEIETDSGADDLADWPMLSTQFRLRKAISVASRITDSTLKTRTLDFLMKIQLVLSVLEKAGYDVDSLPTLEAVVAEDNSLLLEWAAPNYRLGFGLETDPSDSSWFLITARDFGGLNASGLLSGIELTRLLLWLLWFIVSGF